MGTIPASENVFPIIRLDEVAAPSTPPTGEVHLYAKSDGLLYWKDDAGTEYPMGAAALTLDDISDVNASAPTDGDVLTWDSTPGEWKPVAPSGGSLALDDLTDVATSGAATDDVLTYNGSSWAPAAPTGGGGTDPIEAAFGTPDTAFEFDANDFTGLTSFGTPDVASMHGTAASHLIIADDDSTQSGYYAAASQPCTLIAKLTDFVASELYQYVGVMVGVGTPGNMTTISLLGGATPSLGVRSFSTPNAGSPGSVSTTRMPNDAVGHATWYFGIRVASNTDVSFYVSRSGVVWTPLALATNPGYTIGSLGLSVGNYAGGTQPRAAGAYDYMRIWNSAKTFPAFS